MAMNKTKGKGWPKIGTLRKGDYGNYIKLEENVTILVDGEPVDLNDSRTVSLEDPRKKAEFFFDNGHITEADFDKRMEVLEENAWLRYELVVPPSKSK